MDAKEAKRILMSDADYNNERGKGRQTADALCMAVDALEKQIPMKPIKSRYLEDIYPDQGSDVTVKSNHYCPTCRYFIFRSKRCYVCGQAIDWSDVEPNGTLKEGVVVK